MKVVVTDHNLFKYYMFSRIPFTTAMNIYFDSIFNKFKLNAAKKLSVIENQTITLNHLSYSLIISDGIFSMIYRWPFCPSDEYHWIYLYTYMHFHICISKTYFSDLIWHFSYFKVWHINSFFRLKGYATFKPSKIAIFLINYILKYEFSQYFKINL